jgi:hypothetical protein
MTSLKLHTALAALLLCLVTATSAVTFAEVRAVVREIAPSTGTPSPSTTAVTTSTVSVSSTRRPGANKLGVALGSIGAVCALAVGIILIARSVLRRQ